MFCSERLFYLLLSGQTMNINMKKLSNLLTLCLFIMLPANMNAQNAKEATSNFGDKVSNIWRSTTKKVSKALGLPTSEDVIRVGGKDYMPLYAKNLYDKEGGAELRKQCEALFMAKYPNAKIQTTVLPQTEWNTHAIEKKGSIIGYVEDMYCYIIASDENDGYINARFCFRQSREVGESYRQVPDEWPKWERTDILTKKVYNKLLKK